MNPHDEILKIRNELLDEFDKRVEALKEEQEFPKSGGDYWYVDNDTEIMEMEWCGSKYDQGRLAVGNVFKTEQQAEFALGKLIVEAELRKFSRTFMWGTENTAMLFDGDNIKFDTRLAYVFQGAIYFESEKKAKQAIESVGEERIKKYIFGVED